MTLWYCKSVGNPKNKVFPTKTDDLSLASKFDHVMCEFKGNSRAEDNFISCDCLYADIDNSQTEDEEDWITPNKFAVMFHEYEWHTVTSRNHMKEKEGKKPRPKFHVYFPIKRIDKVETLKMWLEKLTKKYIFFDPAVKDGARLFFGNPEGVINHNIGKSILQDLYNVELNEKKPALKTKHEDIEAIGAGERNTTLFKMGCKWVNQYSDFEDVCQLLEQANESLKEPLDREEMEQLIGSVGKFADEQSDPDTLNGKKIIRNYVTERKVVKTDKGKRKIKIQKISLDFTPEMDEPKPLFASFIDGSGERFLFRRGEDCFIKDAITMDHHLKQNGFLLDFNCPNASITEKKLFTHYAKSCDAYNRMTCIPEINPQSDTYYRTEDIKPKNNGLFRKMLDTFTLQTESDSIRFGAGLLSNFLNSTYDGAKPLFTVIADSKSSGKTDVVQTGATVISGSTPLMFYCKKEDEQQLSGIKAYLNPNILYDNLQDVTKEQMLAITLQVTAKDIASHVMYQSHSQIRNSKTYWATFNSEQGINDDLLNRGLFIRMQDGRDNTPEKKARISNLIVMMLKNRKEIIADILWHLEQVDWQTVVPVKKHIKFSRWSEDMAKILKVFYPEVEEFDFSMSKADAELSDERNMMTEFVEDLLGDKNEVFYATTYLVDCWRDRYRSGKTTAKSFTTRLKNMSKSLHEYEFVQDQQLKGTVRARGWIFRKK